MEKYLKEIIGNLVFQVASLQAKIQELEILINKLKSENKDLVP